MDKCPNYAFIDGNNLHQGTQVDGWVTDYKKLREYLFSKFSVMKAYYFIGYIPQKNDYHNLYHSLLKSGYILKFKRIKTYNNSDIKGNVDAELITNTLQRIKRFNKAIIVAGDDDYYCLLKYLISENKLLNVVTPNIQRCPRLFKKSLVKDYLFYLYNIKNKIKYKDVPIKK